MTTVVASKTLASDSREWSATELHEEGMDIIRRFLDARGYEALGDGFSESKVVFRDPEDGATVLARLGFAAGGEEEGTLPLLEHEGDSMSSIRRECLAYTAEHPKCACARGDVISLIVFDGHPYKLPKSLKC